jgi:choline monooxygenase
MQKDLVITDLDLAVLPIEETETIRSSWYTSPAILEMEKEHIFAHSWQLVGRAEQVRNAGDYLVAEIAGEPIIVVRGKDGVLRGFYNVCRHRGGPLATEDGCASNLQCKYHGWTYDLNGSLRATPSFDNPSFDKSKNPLAPISLGEWEGLVFISLSPASLNLDTFLGGISERIAPIEISKLKFHWREVYNVKCNWKVYVDNYLEGYHVPHVHPELFKMYNFRDYSYEIGKYYSLQHCPIKPGENIYAPGGGTAFYYFIFPNLALNIMPGRMQTNLILPIDAGTTSVIFDYYYAEGTAQEIMDEDIRFSDDVQKEDIAICELVERGLRSRSYDKGKFSPEHEQAVYHFQSLLKKYIGAK